MSQLLFLFKREFTRLHFVEWMGKYFTHLYPR